MTSYDDNNIFAKILREEIPCDKVFEDTYALAFKDISPVAPIHVLVIPKGPYVSISDFAKRASDVEIVGFYKAAAHVAEQLGVTENGFRTIANTGSDGGQEVPHFHLHIIGGEPIGPMRGK